MNPRLRHQVPHFDVRRIELALVEDRRDRRKTGKRKRKAAMAPVCDPIVPITPYRLALEAKSAALDAEFEGAKTLRRCWCCGARRVSPDGLVAEEILKILRAAKEEDEKERCAPRGMLTLHALGRALVALEQDPWEVEPFVRALAREGRIRFYRVKDARGHWAWIVGA